MQTNRRSTTTRAVVVSAITCALSVWGCTDERIPTQPSSVSPWLTQEASRSQSSSQSPISVATVDQLYDAVNDVQHAGRRVLMASGVYYLTATDMNGAARPNGGRLELQRDMELRGAGHDPSAVVIDGSQLPAASFAIPPFQTGAIRMGRGSTALEWLTVRRVPLAVAAIETDLVAPGVAHVRIANVIAEGSQRGIDVRNLGVASAGRILEADLTDNVMVGNVAGEGHGIRFVNTNGATGAVIRARLKGNRAHGNLVGCNALTLNSNSASIAIESKDDRFDGNGTGCAITGGIAMTASVTANGNVTTFEAKGSSFSNNTGAPSAAFSRGGIVTTGGRAAFAGRASNNRVEITLKDVEIGGNAVADILAWGALSPSAGPAGTYNSVVVSLKKVSTAAIISVTPSSPVEPAGTNTVTVLRP